MSVNVTRAPDLSRKGIEDWVNTIDYGYVCETCGLSDWGMARMRLFKFPPKPCHHCREHFNDHPNPS